MTKEKVLENMPTEMFQPRWYYDFGAMMFVTLIVIVAMFMVVVYFKQCNMGTETTAEDIKFGVAGIVMILVFGTVLIFQISWAATGTKEHTEDKINWEDNYVGVYIEQQPEIKEEIVNEMEIKGTTYKYANITVNQNGEAVSLRNIDIVLDLETLEDPYITYRELTEEIGWIEAGYYQYKLHLPKDYQFKQEMKNK